MRLRMILGLSTIVMLLAACAASKKAGKDIESAGSDLESGVGIRKSGAGSPASDGGAGDASGS